MDLHSDIIRFGMSQPETIFQQIEQAICYEYSKPAHNIAEMKERANMTAKGHQWELFCRDWLVHRHNLNGPIYQQVWLFQDYAREFNLSTRQDNGIDLIGLTVTGDYHAVQCKFRSGKGRVTWTSLATFVALSNQTDVYFRPRTDDTKIWSKRVVMTNCRQVSNKKFTLPGDENICLGSFTKTSREHWERMIGTCTYRRLNEEAPIPISSTRKPTLSQLRELRLQKFSNLEQ